MLNATSTDVKVALVTGASKGIGQAVAERLARDGSMVGIHYGMDQAGASETVRRIESHGGKARLVQGNVAKAGDVENMFEQSLSEFAAKRITVNAVAPGPVDTALFRKGNAEAQLQIFAGFSPMNRVGRTGEIADIVSFLASAGASWVTGQVVRANGGWV